MLFAKTGTQCRCDGRAYIRNPVLAGEKNTGPWEIHRNPLEVSTFGPTTAGVRGNQPIELAAEVYFSAVSAEVLPIWY